jgi:hypothetical protein
MYRIYDYVQNINYVITMNGRVTSLNKNGRSDEVFVLKSAQRDKRTARQSKRLQFSSKHHKIQILQTVQDLIFRKDNQPIMIKKHFKLQYM